LAGIKSEITQKMEQEVQSVSAMKGVVAAPAAVFEKKLP
jgi:hypothetical protein